MSNQIDDTGDRMNISNQLVEENKLTTNMNAERIARRIGALSEIGITPDGGSCRIGYSAEDRKAKELLKSWMKEAGLEVREDAIGNVIGKLHGTQPDLPVVLTGSHIDTVPNGGHFDGVVGVITALESAQLWNEQGFVPKRGLEVVAFTDEEGSRFHASLTGSHFFMGELNVDTVAHYRDDEGHTFSEVLEAHGLHADHSSEAAREPDSLHAYVELHIEQGPVLENRQLPVGVVSGIAGMAWLEMKWRGKANHAGTTPMNMRSDALTGASECMLAIERLPQASSETAVATVGRIEVLPNGSNVVPGEVRFIVDIRDIDLAARDGLIAAIRSEAEAIAKRRGLQLEQEVTIAISPTPMSHRLIRIVEDSIEAAGYPAHKLSSGAGHDAMIIGRHVPAAMIFIRCRDGISHNPQEWSTLSDIAIGAEVLERTLRQLVEEE